MEDEESYLCQKCGNIIPISEKASHDKECKSNISINDISLISDNTNINNHYFFDNSLDTYTCTKCGQIIQLKDKSDHLLCHQLEMEIKENGTIIDNDSNKSNDSNSDSNSSDEESEEEEDEDDNNTNANVINNIHINIVNNNSDGTTFQQSYHYVQPNHNRNNNNFNNNNININNNINNFNNVDNDENEINEDEEDIGEEGPEEYDEEDNINNAVDTDTVNTFPVTKVKDTNKLKGDKKKCCICLEKYKKNEEIMTLPCIHIFHSFCIKKWFETQNICPICKIQIC